MSTHSTNHQSYTIREASRLSGLPESTLRYYETIGIIDPIDRDASSKHRVYNQKDIDLIDAVACLSATGMSIDDMRAYMANLTKGEQGNRDEILLLENQKQRLKDEAHYLALRQDYVDTKIAYWHAVSSGDDRQVQTMRDKARAIARDLKFPGITN